VGFVGSSNEALHADPSNCDILKSQANDQIRLVYMQGSTTLPCNALAMLHEPLSIQLQKPLATKLLWLESIQAAQNCKACHDHGLMAGKQWVIQQFLGLE